MTTDNPQVTFLRNEHALIEQVTRQIRVELERRDQAFLTALDEKLRAIQEKLKQLLIEIAAKCRG